ncbi:hypothetical protein QWJ41_01240 [Nocardioides sp. SOB44]|uniref:ESX-1 secretion-associated protein n=1 Tax=Nocardioides cremeus TaxID=3058044 RepID=A0ABT8TPA0_9ACTN|nr:hypothetical protein [Nocardioides cremeus]MDO3394336.1 hypothetical protein [Nocardioides cremeus]
MLEVSPDTVATAAGRVDAAASAILDVDAVTPFSAGEALPGSQVAQACLWVSTRLGAALQVYGDSLGSLATAARETAATVSAADAGVSTQLGRGMTR